MEQNTHNDDVANMKLKHPYVALRQLNNGCLGASLRKVISDNKLSFMFNRYDVTTDTEGWGIEDGYIYFKPLSCSSDFHELHYNRENQETIENTLITVWIFEGRTPGRNGIESYTKIKGYRKNKTCSCFMAIEIESQTQHDVPFVL